MAHLERDLVICINGPPVLYPDLTGSRFAMMQGSPPTGQVRQRTWYFERVEVDA